MNMDQAKIQCLYLLITGVFFILLGLLLSAIFPLLWWLFILAGLTFCVFSATNLIRHLKKE
jgi:hypothetical protein